jgi:hypothetical protein
LPATNASYEPCSFAMAFSISGTHSCLRLACNDYGPISNCTSSHWLKGMS